MECCFLQCIFCITATLNTGQSRYLEFDGWNLLFFYNPDVKERKENSAGCFTFNLTGFSDKQPCSTLTRCLLLELSTEFLFMKFKNGSWHGHKSHNRGYFLPTSSAEWKDVACRGGRPPPARLSPNMRGRPVSISRRCLSAESSVVDGVVLKCPADARSSPTHSLGSEDRAGAGGGGVEGQDQVTDMFLDDT